MQSINKYNLKILKLLGNLHTNNISKVQNEHKVSTQKRNINKGIGNKAKKEIIKIK